MARLGSGVVMKIMVQLMNGPRSENPDTIGEYGPYNSFQEALDAHIEDNDDVARVVSIYDKGENNA